MLADFDTAHALRSVSLRYFNAAGADPDGELGEVHDPETHLIPLALDAAAGCGPELTVFGDDYDTPDGTCIRDYVHVSDLAEGHVLALGRLQETDRSDALNLGTGAGASVLDVIDAVERATGKPVPRIVGRRREGDPPVLVSEASRALESLDWKPAHSDLDTIVSTAWAWHQRVHG